MNVTEMTATQAAAAAAAMIADYGNDEMSDEHKEELERLEAIATGNPIPAHLAAPDLTVYRPGIRSGLQLHCGANLSTLDEIRAAQTPAGTRTHIPIPHITLIDKVMNQLHDGGATIEHTAFALSHAGNRMFGLIQLRQNDNTTGRSVIIGLRNSHDQSFPAAILAGLMVWVCDNLSIAAEITETRRHTIKILAQLDQRISRALGRLGSATRYQEARINAYEHTELTVPQGHSLLIGAARREIIAPSRIIRAVDAWEAPDRPRNVWGLFNAVTETLRPVLRADGQTFEAAPGLQDLPKRTMQLHGLCDLASGLHAFTPELEPIAVN